jgi:hypothetical protein
MFSGRSELTPSELCAVESAARHNPSATGRFPQVLAVKFELFVFQFLVTFPTPTTGVYILYLPVSLYKPVPCDFKKGLS